MNFEKQQEIPFEDMLKERFSSQPMSMAVVEQVFNMVDGGFGAVDNAKLNEDEIKRVIRVIQEPVETYSEQYRKFDASAIRKAILEINNIIDEAIDRAI